MLMEQERYMLYHLQGYGYSGIGVIMICRIFNRVCLFVCQSIIHRGVFDHFDEYLAALWCANLPSVPDNLKLLTELSLTSDGISLGSVARYTCSDGYVPQVDVDMERECFTDNGLNASWSNISNMDNCCE